MTTLRVAMIGQRGVPAAYGGIERHVEELGARLATRGHHVTVFCRTNYVERRVSVYRGMRLAHLPTVGTKHLDAIVHSTACTVMALGDRYDVIHYHALGPGVLAPLPKLLSSAAVVQTVHGLDQERGKWTRPARAFLTGAGWLSARVPDATITVSHALAEHYRHRYGTDAVPIPNGVTPPGDAPSTGLLGVRWGLERGRYFLFVGRLVPEKAPHLLLGAFRRLPPGCRLILVGGSSFTNRYATELRSRAAALPGVVLPGYVYGDALAELYAGALAFVLPSTVEGLPLTLLEAAAYGTPVVASDIAPHLEILDQDGPGRRLFPCGDEDALERALRRCLEDPDRERAGGAGLRREVISRYRWEDVAEQTERVYLQALQAPSPRRRNRVLPRTTAPGVL